MSSNLFGQIQSTKDSFFSHEKLLILAVMKKGQNLNFLLLSSCSLIEETVSLKQYISTHKIEVMIEEAKSLKLHLIVSTFQIFII